MYKVLSKKKKKRKKVYSIFFKHIVNIQPVQHHKSTMRFEI